MEMLIENVVLKQRILTFVLDTYVKDESHA
jgi:hypothetical protein